VVRGARRAQLVELDGFLISELPWYLEDDPLFIAMREPFALDGNRFSALYALGADALRLAMMLDLLPRDNSSVMFGSTGALSLDQDGRFHRELRWASVRNGRISAATLSGSNSSD
jgi:outer membrane PBP1 activator LpoA protein